MCLPYLSNSHYESDYACICIVINGKIGSVPLNILSSVVSLHVVTLRDVIYLSFFLQTLFRELSAGVLLDGWLRMGLLPPPPREFCRHILSCRELKAESFKRCLHSVLRGVSL